MIIDYACVPKVNHILQFHNIIENFDKSIYAASSLLNEVNITIYSQ